MRGVLTILGSVAVALGGGLALALSDSAFATQPPVISMPIGQTPSSETASQRSPGFTLSVSAYPLRCGHPIGTAAIVFPAAVGVPRTISPAAVRINGVPAARIAVSGRTVSVAARQPSGVTCHSIALGPLTMLFTPQAGLQVAAKRATSATVKHGGRVYRARLVAA